jgi:hypothetical protein
MISYRYWDCLSLAHSQRHTQISQIDENPYQRQSSTTSVAGLAAATVPTSLMNAMKALTAASSINPVAILSRHVDTGCSEVLSDV